MSQMLPPYASPDVCMTIAKRTYQQMLDELAGYKVRVAELERIPEWMTDYHDIHGHFPTANHVRDQFGINP